MTSNLVSRLRDHAVDLEGYGGIQDRECIDDLRDAAAELERLRSFIAELGSGDDSWLERACERILRGTAGSKT